MPSSPATASLLSHNTPLMSSNKPPSVATENLRSGLQEIKEKTFVGFSSQKKNKSISVFSPYFCKNIFPFRRRQAFSSPFSHWFPTYLPVFSLWFCGLLFLRVQRKINTGKNVELTSKEIPKKKREKKKPNTRVANVSFLWSQKEWMKIPVAQSSSGYLRYPSLLRFSFSRCCVARFWLLCCFVALPPLLDGCGRNDTANSSSPQIGNHGESEELARCLKDFWKRENEAIVEVDFRLDRCLQLRLFLTMLEFEFKISSTYVCLLPTRQQTSSPPSASFCCSVSECSKHLLL